MARRVRTFLCLDRVEAVNTSPMWGEWTDSDSDDYLFLDHPPVQVQFLVKIQNVGVCDYQFIVQYVLG